MHLGGHDAPAHSDVIVITDETHGSQCDLIARNICNALPRAYTTDFYHHACDLVYQHVYDSYFGSGRGIYARASGNW